MTGRPAAGRMWLDAIEIPSLDEHIEDIPELLEYYVNWYSDRSSCLTGTSMSPRKICCAISLERRYQPAQAVRQGYIEQQRCPDIDSRKSNRLCMP